MLSRSADYALRAVLFMAQRGAGRACSADAVAEAIGVPRNYMGKVLHTLVRAGMLTSVRGPRGGFRLIERPERLTLEHVIAPFQRLPDRRVCLLGNRACDPGTPCTAHQRWRRMSEPVTQFFRETTVAVMLRPLNEVGATTGAGPLVTFVPRGLAAASGATPFPSDGGNHDDRTAPRLRAGSGGASAGAATV